MKRIPRFCVVMAAALGGQCVATVAASERDRCATPQSDLVAAPSTGASWAVIDRCAEDSPLLPRDGEDVERTLARLAECRQALRTIVRSGTDADREALWSRFEERADDPLMEAQILETFLDAQVESSLAALEESPATAFDPPLAQVEMPEVLRQGPADLQQAWLTYQAIVEAEQDGDEVPDGEEIPLHSKRAAFRRTIAAFLRGRRPPADAVRELTRYELGGGCGLGSGLMYGTRAKVVLIAHLRAGRPDLALAASGDIDPSPFAVEEPTARWDRRLLSAAGVDWESFLLGGALSGRKEMADDLARDGSERAASRLLDAVRLIGAEERQTREEDSLLWPLAALVETTGLCGDYTLEHPSEVRRSCQAEPISGDLQAEVLDLLAAKVGPEAGLREAGVASHLLVRLCRAESRPAFRAMLRSRYQEARELGVIGLRAHGETVADAGPSRPVAFRIVVDGRPAAGQQVAWILDWEDEDQDSGGTVADEHGIIRLARDPFVDPSRRLASVRLSAPDLSSARDLWFAATVEPPADLETMTTVSVRTGSLTVVIPPSLLDGARESSAMLQLVARGDAGPSLLASSGMPVASTHIRFPNLQRGEYEVWLYRTAGFHGSSIVAVDERPATLTVSEIPASDEIEEE